MDIPTYKPRSNIRKIPYFIVIAVLSILFYFTLFKDDILIAIIFGACIVVIYRYIIRYTIIINGVKGIKFLKKGDFDKAIICFEKSNSFFLAHKILDKYGYIVFLNSSKYTYREPILINLAFLYAQKGDINKAKEYYEECLKINPQNEIAISSLNFINYKEK